MDGRLSAYSITEEKSHERGSGPKQAHKLTDEVLTFINEARQKEPSLRLPELAKLVEEGFGMNVHPRSIERSLLRHQKNAAERTCSPTGRPPGPGYTVRATAQ